MAVTDVSFHQRAVTEFLVNVGNSAGVVNERLRGVYGDACMGTSSARRWLKHVKDGNTDIAHQPRCGRPRTAAVERNKRKVDGLIRQEHSEKLQRSLEWGIGPKKKTVLFQHDNARPHTACLTLHRIRKNGWELLYHPPYSPDLALSDYHLFGPLKDHLRGHHHETDEAVQEAVRSWLRGAGTDFYCIGVNLQRWQIYIDRDGDFV
jgi:transposase